LEKLCANIVKEKEEAGVEDKDKKEGDEKKEEQKIDVSHLKDKKGIPDFWYKAMENNKMIWGEAVKDHDKDILKHLVDVESVMHEDKNESDRIPVELKFEFSENDFFENKTLSTKIIFKGQDDPQEIVGTEI